MNTFRSELGIFRGNEFFKAILNQTFTKGMNFFKSNKNIYIQVYNEYFSI